MARTQINLNRFRKIYPQLRKSPFWWSGPEGATESHQHDASGGLSLVTTNHYNSPIVIATCEDNVNVWVATLEDPDIDKIWNITLGISDTSFAGIIHVHIYEGSP